MDGVILEDPAMPSSVRRRALDSLLTDWGLTVTDDVRPALERGKYDDAFVDACKRVDVDPPGFFDALEDRTADRAIEQIKAGAREPYPDVDSLTDIAKDADIGLVSNHYDRAVQFVVDYFGFDDLRVARGRNIGVEGFEKRKPDPYYLNETLEALQASDGMYVGDRETDLLAAERAGLDGVFVRRDHNADLELSVEPAAEIESLEELVPLITRRRT